MAKTILWLDNDPGSTHSYVQMLRRIGYQVESVDTLMKGEEALGERHYDLLLLDVMIPTRGIAEEARYPPEETKMGYEAGFAFFEKMRDRLHAAGTKVMLLSVRPRADLEERMQRLDPKEVTYQGKIAMRDSRVLAKKIEELIGPPD